MRKLREGDPAIWIRGNIINTLCLKGGEEKIVAKRLKEILSQPLHISLVTNKLAAPRSGDIF